VQENALSKDKRSGRRLKNKELSSGFGTGLAFVRVSAVSTRRLPEGLGSSKLEIILMKIAMLAVCILGSSAAFAQAATSSSVNAQPQVYTFESHPEHASRKALRSAENLNGNEIVVYAQGERPLWELATPVYEVPLGDSARALRQEHAMVKRAARCWQNQ
jgi:hypothetical protein